MTGQDDTLDALTDLAHALRALGWDTQVRDGSCPFVRIMHGCLTTEYVFVGRYATPHYTWSCTTREHPLDDPAGAAQRITNELTSRMVQP